MLNRLKDVGDLTIPAMWLGAFLVIYWQTPLALLIGSLLLMAGVDGLLFGRVLKWMPVRNSAQLASSAAVIADKTISDTPPSSSVELFKAAHDRAQYVYRWFQHTLNFGLAIYCWTFGDPAISIALLIATWYGVHDLLYHILLMHRLKLSAEQPWMWWTPAGLFAKFVFKDSITGWVMVIQALIGLSLSIQLLIHFNLI